MVRSHRFGSNGNESPNGEHARSLICLSGAWLGLESKTQENANKSKVNGFLWLADGSSKPRFFGLVLPSSRLLSSVDVCVSFREAVETFGFQEKNLQTHTLTHTRGHTER